MKKVYDPELQEVRIIDEEQYPDRMTRFRHCSGKPFELPEWYVAPSITPAPKKEKTIDEMTVKQLQKLYLERYGKEPATAYKTRKDRLISKLS